MLDRVVVIVVENCQKTAGVGSKVSEVCQKMVRIDLILWKKWLMLERKSLKTCQEMNNQVLGFINTSSLHDRFVFICEHPWVSRINGTPLRFVSV